MLRMKNIQTLLFITLFLSPLLSFAQDCTDYHQYHCMYADYTFFYSRQSKSALFRRGQTSELKIVAYSGEDYYIAVCAHRKFGDIQFKILEDNANKTLIYDNAEDEYAESLIFSNEVTRNLIIQVSVPDADIKESADDRRCVGVVIEFRKTDSVNETTGKHGL